MTGPGKPCLDCGWFTWQPSGQSEWYMVHDYLWRQAGAPTRRVSTPGDGYYLCVGCLETRLGRTLTAADFTAAPLNEPSTLSTGRLNDRLNT